MEIPFSKLWRLEVQDQDQGVGRCVVIDSCLLAVSSHGRRGRSE